MGKRIINLYVKPHSKIQNITMIDDNDFEIAIISKPEKGKANKEIIEVLADFLNIKKSQISIIKGHKSQHKIIQIDDL